MVGLRTAVKSFTYVESLTAQCSSVRYERASSPGILRVQTVGLVAGGGAGHRLKPSAALVGLSPKQVSCCYSEWKKNTDKGEQFHSQIQRNRFYV